MFSTRSFVPRCNASGLHLVVLQSIPMFTYAACYFRFRSNAKETLCKFGETVAIVTVKFVSDIFDEASTG